MNNLDIKTVFYTLIGQNGTTTSLEVKNELRKRFPNSDIRQTDVSADLKDLSSLDSNIDVTDNGVYLTYSIVNIAQSQPQTILSKTKLNELFEDCANDNIVVDVEFLNKDLDVKNYTGVPQSGFTALGYRQILVNGTDYKTFLPTNLITIDVPNVGKYMVE